MRDLQTEFSSLSVTPVMEKESIGPSGFKAVNNKEENGMVGMQQKQQLTPTGGGLKRCKFSLNSNILDIGVLAERCMDDWELVREVVVSFCDQCDARLASLELSLVNSDIDQVLFDLDFLSGASMNVGALDLNNAIQNLGEALGEAAANRHDSMEEDQPTDDASSPSPLDCDLPPTQLAPSRGGVEGPESPKIRKRMSRENSFSKSSINLLRSQPLQSFIWQDRYQCIRLHYQAAVAYWTQLTRKAGLDEESDDDETMSHDDRLRDFLAAQDHSLASSNRSDPSSGWSSTEDAHFMEDSIASPSVHRQNLLKEEFNGAVWSENETVSAFFRRAMHQVQLVRKCMNIGARNDIRVIAGDLRELSEEAGLMQISRKAQVLEALVPSDLRQSHVDSLEQQIDASVAIWDRCRLKI